LILTSENVTVFTFSCVIYVCSILIGHNDILKISDFGTSKEFQEHERSMIMSFAGTYAWMAPEVIKNEPCSEKVDVW